MLTEAEKREMRQMISANQHEVYILSLEEMDHVFASILAHYRRSH